MWLRLFKLIVGIIFTIFAPYLAGYYASIPHPSVVHQWLMGGMMLISIAAILFLVGGVIYLAYIYVKG